MEKKKRFYRYDSLLVEGERSLLQMDALAGKKEQLEQLLAELERGSRAFAFRNASLACEAMGLRYVPDGGRVIVSEDASEESVSLMEQSWKKRSVTLIRTSMQSPEDLEEELSKGAQLVYLETPGTYKLEICDIASIAKATREHGAKLLVNNRNVSSCFQKPLLLGADAVWYSDCGLFKGAATDASVWIESQEDGEGSIAKEGGVSEEEAGAILLGLSSLSVRMQRMEENADFIARKLERSNAVSIVRYPGLDNYMEYRIANAQMIGFGNRLVFRLHGGEREFRMFLESLELIRTEETVPISSTCIQVVKTPYNAAQEKEKPALLRIETGLESTYDLSLDIEYALERIEKPRRDVLN